MENRGPALDEINELGTGQMNVTLKQRSLCSAHRTSQARKTREISKWLRHGGVKHDFNNMYAMMTTGQIHS